MKAVDDTEVLDLLRESRKRMAKEEENEEKNEDDMEMEEEGEDEMEDEKKMKDGEEKESEDEMEESGDNEENIELSSDTDTVRDERPEFEREAELAKEYEDEAQAKRKHELLYRSKKSPSNRQDSALMKLRNARQRKIKGIKLSSSEDESEYDEDGYQMDSDDKDEESEEDGDEESEDEEVGRNKRRGRQRRKVKRGNSKYDSSGSEEYSEDSGYEERRGRKKARRTSKAQESNLFEEESQQQEKILKRCEKVLESISLKLMKSVHLTKDRIEFMLEHPKFSEFLAGSYVKVPIINPATNSEIFLICEVFDSHFDEENKCTLTLQRGGSKKDWGIESISNDSFNNGDLLEWKAMIKEFYSNDPDYILSLPRILHKKAQGLSSFQYGDEEIALILEKKQKASNSLSGKILIESRTNIQTQIKQLEMQLKNIGLDKNQRASKLAKIDQLQQELEETVSQIEKLKLQKEMIHPDKSLRITSSRYIGGVEGKGTGASNFGFEESKTTISKNENSCMNKASKLLHKLVFGPISQKTSDQTCTSPTSTSKESNLNSKSLISQSSEPNFGRRECRPSVMWETKRNKPNIKHILKNKQEVSQADSESQSKSQKTSERLEVVTVQECESSKDFVSGVDDAIIEFKNFFLSVNFDILTQSKNESYISIPPLSNSWDPSGFIAKSHKNKNLNLSFQELLNLVKSS
ncbi:Plus-3 domain protein [Cryptosporidium felis]|nr:Plus-3 domain protein [Cryptosporidium felis]